MRLFVCLDAPPLPPFFGTDPPQLPPEVAVPEHLTLRFLGEVSETVRGEVGKALRPIGSEVAPFELSLNGIGAFPSSHRPRIVWVAVERGREEVTRLASLVEEALGRIGMPPEPRPFAAHVTWRRIRSPRERRQAEEWLKRGRLPAPRTATVGALLLKESRSGPAGVIHRVLVGVPLEGKGESPGARGNGPAPAIPRDPPSNPLPPGTPP